MIAPRAGLLRDISWGQAAAERASGDRGAELPLHPRAALPRPPSCPASARRGCLCPACAPPCARISPAISPLDASPDWEGCGTERSTGREGARRGIGAREVGAARTWEEECARVS